MKKKVLIVTALIAVAAAIGIGTYAYTTTEGTIKGTVNSSNLECKLHETDSAGKELDADAMAYDMIPGAVIDRKAYVENVGTEPMYVRIYLDEAVKKAASAQDVDTETLNRAQENLENVMKFDFDFDNWTVSDGYYYYNKVLASGEKTAPLFTEIEFDGSEMNNDYRGLVMGLRVSAETVQSKNNGSDPLKAAGWA